MILLTLLRFYLREQLILNDSPSADVNADPAKGRIRNRQAVADGVHVLHACQHIDLPVVQQNLSLIRDEQRRVIHPLADVLRQAGYQPNPVFPGDLA